MDINAITVVNLAIRQIEILNEVKKFGELSPRDSVLSTWELDFGYPASSASEAEKEITNINNRMADKIVIAINQAIKQHEKIIKEA